MERSHDNHGDQGVPEPSSIQSATRRHLSTWLSKVHYRPLEAAIRWSGLLRHEARILADLKGKSLPDADDFPCWPALRLNTERIYDAIANKELRFGINGARTAGEPPLDDPNLTVRHVDLRAWMKRYYPAERPAFLFSRMERKEYPLTIDAVEALLIHREALKCQIEQRDHEIQTLRGRRVESTKKQALDATDTADTDLTPRREITYQYAVSALVHLLLGRSPTGVPYSSFRSQDAIVSALVAHYGDRPGIGERTLHGLFAAANKRFGSP